MAGPGVVPAATDAPQQEAKGDRKVVIDAGAVIKLQRLERFGGELYTTSSVLGEVRDEHARALLGTLPEEIRVREALPQDLAFTKQFAKATGDLGYLSQNDMQLIALTVGLHREAGGQVRERPALIGFAQANSCPFDWAPPAPAKAAPEAGSQPAGAPAAPPTDAVEAPAAAAPAEPAAAGPAQGEASPAGAAPAEGEAAQQPEPVQADAAEVPAQSADTSTSVAASAEPTAASGPDAQEDDGGEQAEDDEEDGSSAGEWVTPENMHRFGLGVEPATEMKVTCATADYAVQNVLLQMGITPLTFDGYAVRTVKLWGLICRGCMHFTRDTQRIFCPKCGNDTVVRVPIVVEQDGSVQMLSTGRPMRLKGSVYSIPKARGGRQRGPVYAEDELMMGGRDRERRHAERLCDKERLNRDPFNADNGARSWYQRTQTGSGRMIGGPVGRLEAGYGRRNPNANNFKHKNKRR